MWPGFDGKPYDRTQLAQHINSCDFSQWRNKHDQKGKPKFITLHNTSSPTIKLWLSWSREKRQQYILNVYQMYQDMGWKGGPHFFVPPDDQIVAFGFNNLMTAGTHASCFNEASIGIEMVGEFNDEDFMVGPGSKVQDNAIYLMALLHNRIGLSPLPYAYGQQGLHFHIECKHDNHDCPGKHVDKSHIIQRLQYSMAALKGQSTPEPLPPMTPPRPIVSVGKTTIDKLNLRRGAGIDFESIGMVPQGTTLQISGSTMNGSTEWLHARTPAGYEGWVASKYAQQGAA